MYHIIELTNFDKKCLIAQDNKNSDERHKNKKFIYQYYLKNFKSKLDFDDVALPILFASSSAISSILCVGGGGACRHSFVNNISKFQSNLFEHGGRHTFSLHGSGPGEGERS